MIDWFALGYTAGLLTWAIGFAVVTQLRGRGNAEPWEFALVGVATGLLWPIAFVVVGVSLAARFILAGIERWVDRRNSEASDP